MKTWKLKKVTNLRLISSFQTHVSHIGFDIIDSLIASELIDLNIGLITGHTY